jgi:hypothetical protein
MLTNRNILVLSFQDRGQYGHIKQMKNKLIGIIALLDRRVKEIFVRFQTIDGNSLGNYSTINNLKL